MLFLQPCLSTLLSICRWNQLSKLLYYYVVYWNPDTTSRYWTSKKLMQHLDKQKRKTTCNVNSSMILRHPQYYEETPERVRRKSGPWKNGGRVRPGKSSKMYSQVIQESFQAVSAPYRNADKEKMTETTGPNWGTASYLIWWWLQIISVLNSRLLLCPSERLYN